MGKALQALVKVQSELKAPKNQYNSFGKYKYRSCEDILQAARPLCNENGLVLTVSDDVVMIGNRFYIKAVACVTDAETGEQVTNTAYAREDESKKGMDASQLTGACSSYARKYSLCGLFAIDDTKDADTEEYSQKPSQNAQQAAGAPKPKQANTSSQDEKKAVLKALMEHMKKDGMGAEEMKLLIQKKFGKASSAELSLQECKILAANYQKLWQQLMDELGKGDAA